MAKSGKKRTVGHAKTLTPMAGGKTSRKLGCGGKIKKK